jgi:hypothetical protein
VSLPMVGMPESSGDFGSVATFQDGEVNLVTFHSRSG